MNFQWHSVRCWLLRSKGSKLRFLTLAMGLRNVLEQLNVPEAEQTHINSPQSEAWLRLLQNLQRPSFFINIMMFRTLRHVNNSAQSSRSESIISDPRQTRHINLSRPKLLFCARKFCGRFGETSCWQLSPFLRPLMSRFILPVDTINLRRLMIVWVFRNLPLRLS